MPDGLDPRALGATAQQRSAQSTSEFFLGKFKRAD
jgi:hypothetical protein